MRGRSGSDDCSVVDPELSSTPSVGVAYRIYFISLSQQLG